MGARATAGPVDAARSPGAVLRTLDASAVTLDAGLLAQRQAVNREAALPHGLRMLETAGNLDEYQPKTKHGGHAVALVGYTPDRFIVRNSWGTSWGDGGFAYASLAYAQDAFTEAYGISV